MKHYTLFFILLLLISGCDHYPQDDYTQQYVVDAWLVAMEPVPPVRLTTTRPINAFFDLDELGVQDAMLQVRMLDSDGQAEWMSTFVHQGNGLYYPDDNSHTIQPNRIYALEIITASQQHIRATTTIPDTFSVVEINTLGMPYQSEDRFTLTLTRSVNPSRQSYYVFSSETLNPLTAELTPFYANFEEDREDFIIVSSGIINEANSRGSNSDFVELVYPWIGIAFFGPNRLQAAALDDNAFDFIRSASTQLGGGTQSPGEIENVLYNIEGAIGIFGSYSRITADVYVERPGLPFTATGP